MFQTFLFSICLKPISDMITLKNFWKMLIWPMKNTMSMFTVDQFSLLGQNFWQCTQEWLGTKLLSKFSKTIASFQRCMTVCYAKCRRHYKISISDVETVRRFSPEFWNMFPSAQNFSSNFSELFDDFESKPSAWPDDILYKPFNPFWARPNDGKLQRPKLGLLTFSPKVIGYNL